MSVHFAYPTNSETAQAVSPAVRDRGLSLLKAKPCDVHVSVIPTVVQPGYTSYISNIPAFMEATLTNQVVVISNRGYPITQEPHPLPWKLPKLIYSFTQAPTDRVVATLRTHSDVIESKRGRQYVMREPTIDSIRTLVNDGGRALNMVTPHLIGTVNIAAMKMVMMLRRILAGFLLTHAYPAFRHSTDQMPTEGAPTTVSNKRRKVAGTSYIACISNIDDTLVDAMEDEHTEQVSNPPAHDTILLRRAHPTPITGPRWGDYGSIPNASGLFVPYVKELSISDSLTLPNLVESMFIRCLSSHHNGMFTKMDELKSAWGIIATTELGHEISHLAKCIDIAIRAQSTVYPVYSQAIYEGCVISGAGYHMQMNGRVMEPVPYAELQDVVREGMSHARAFQAIAAIVSTETTIDECTTIRMLSTKVKGLSMNELDRQSVVRHAHLLSFPNKYWSTSPTYVLRAMCLLNDPTTAISADVPMHPKYMFSTDHVELVLSAFGHQAPTFMVSNGTRCELRGDPPKNLVTRTITTEAAILDMRFIRENGYIVNNTNNLSARYRDTPLKGADKAEVWKQLSRYGTNPNMEATNAATSDEGVTENTGNADDGLW